MTRNAVETQPGGARLIGVRPGVPGPLRMRCIEAGRRSGFTLLELIIATAILGLVLAGTTKFFISSSTAFSSATVKAYVESRAQVIVDRLVEECVTGHFLSLDPPSPTLAEQIRFEKIVSVTGSTPSYGNPVQVEAVAVAGTTLKALRVWEDFPPYSSIPGTEDSPTTLATNVESLQMTRLGSVLQIDIVFRSEINKEGETYSYRLVTGVKMRN